jgi:predicted PhzF superfamily epimerase YddE/YHI9
MTIYQVDAFTDRVFSGNPAGVCILLEQRTDEWMQQVAAEMNASETAFLMKREDGFDLRWFTPAVEVDLCGHATLASAHVLWETRVADRNEVITFFTRSGALRASRKGNWIELDFPVEPPTGVTTPPLLVRALGGRFLWVGQNRFDYLVEVATEEQVRKMRPDFAKLAGLSCRGIIVTSASRKREYDFVSRFFAPAVGVDEDPVTGSAHCCLAPYWQEKLGRQPLTAYQVSKRGGLLQVRVQGGRTFIAGQAVTVLECKLMEERAS